MVAWKGQETIPLQRSRIALLRSSCCGARKTRCRCGRIVAVEEASDGGGLKATIQRKVEEELQQEEKEEE